MASGKQMKKSSRHRLIELVRKQGIIRTRDADKLGIAREYLRRLRNEGILEQPGRGLYVLAQSKPTEMQSIIEVCKKVPNSVVCLLSALQYHGLTTQLPHEVWIAIGNSSWQAKVDTVKIRITHFSPASFSYGIQKVSIGGVKLRIFNPAKTIADCFKFRNKVGLDVALEALREALAKRIVSVDDISKAASVCRVSTVIQPYLESLV